MQLAFRITLLCALSVTLVDSIAGHYGWHAGVDLQGAALTLWMACLAIGSSRERRQVGLPRN